MITFDAHDDCSPGVAHASGAAPFSTPVTTIARRAALARAVLRVLALAASVLAAHGAHATQAGHTTPRAASSSRLSVAAAPSAPSIAASQAAPSSAAPRAAPSSAAPSEPTPSSYADRPDVGVFIDEMVAAHGFDARALRRFFAAVRYQRSVVKAMSRPVIAPPKWHQYAPQFLSSARIDGGVAFWREHAATLERAQNEFGVPAEVIVAIIGVETFYGRNTGSYRVADALTTLAFDYPRRAEYFRNELKQFLLQTH